MNVLSFICPVYCHWTVVVCVNIPYLTGFLLTPTYLLHWFFFNVGFPKEDSILTTFYDLHFSHHLHILKITIFHMLDLCGQLYSPVGQAWLRVLFQAVNLIHDYEIFSPFPGFEPGTSSVQADMLPTELSWLDLRQVGMYKKFRRYVYLYFTWMIL